MPNDRPRYYSIAVLRSHAHPMDLNTYQQPQSSSSLFSWAISVIQREKIECSNPPFIHTDIPPLGILDQDSIQVDDIRPISDYLDHSMDETIRNQVMIPPKLLKSSASWCFDIIQSSDRRSSCFTHSYGKYARGTGSVLYVGTPTTESLTEDGSNKRHKSHSEEVKSSGSILDCIQLVSPEERKFDASWSDRLQSPLDVRYLSGTEMAMLMGFPVALTTKGRDEGSDNVRTFLFPPNVTMKQQWKLVGNSLNVTVTASVVELGLSLFLYLQIS